MEIGIKLSKYEASKKSLGQLERISTVPRSLPPEHEVWHHFSIYLAIRKVPIVFTAINTMGQIWVTRIKEMILNLYMMSLMMYLMIV